MPLQERHEAVDKEVLQDHLSKALDSAESEHTKYHLREAYQKVIILEGEE